MTRPAIGHIRSLSFHQKSDEQNLKKKKEDMTMKVKMLAYWATTAILVFVMVSGAVGELTHQWGTLETNTILGYPLYLLTIIGVWKVLGAIALVVPGFSRIKEWAYAGMFFNMTGAFLSHAVVGDGANHLIATSCVALLVVASWALRPQSRTLGKLDLVEFLPVRKQPLLRLSQIGIEEAKF
jgi:uncharacterized membrane protein YphA (DoxX/SURF4 family)